MKNNRYQNWVRFKTNDMESNARCIEIQAQRIRSVISDEIQAFSVRTEQCDLIIYTTTILSRNCRNSSRFTYCRIYIIKFAYLLVRKKLCCHKTRNAFSLPFFYCIIYRQIHVYCTISQSDGRSHVQFANTSSIWKYI